jgi:hypothetical protein
MNNVFKRKLRAWSSERYLAVILRTRVEYELIADEARLIGYRSYSTRVSGITVLLYTQGLNSGMDPA